MKKESTIREEELKNRVATAYFGKYDCDRIVGNIDFCVLPKRRDPRQMTFIPDAPILWAEAKNHPTDIHRMLAQLILTIKGEQKGDVEPPRFVGCFDSEKIAFVEYHYILPVFNLNDFNWTQTAARSRNTSTMPSVISSPSPARLQTSSAIASRQSTTIPKPASTTTTTASTTHQTAAGSTATR